MRSPSLVALHRYVAVVCAGGLLALVLLLATRGHKMPEALSVALLALVLGTILAESAPIKFARQNFNEEITVSTTLSFAILLAVGTVWAVTAQVVASLIADVRERKPVERILFNVAQYTLSLAAAGAVLRLLGDLPRDGAMPIAERDLPLALLAAVVFFLVNSILVTAASALSQNVSIWRQWWRDLPFQGVVTIGMLGLAPIVVAAEQFSVFLLPVLAMPLYAVHRAGRQALQSEHQALHDVLTDLPNRGLFRDRVEQALQVAKRDGACVVVMLMDLDRFKEVNDTLGHHHGDELLQQIGPRLQAALRGSDTVARLGGDEFAVLLPAAAEPAAGMEVAEKLLGALERPFKVDGLKLEVGASIGISCFPDHGDDVDTLIRRADVAMYVAKEAHSGVELYSSTHDEHSPDRLALIGDLRRAMDDRELFVVYQPKVALDNGDVVGVEALVRWRHPDRGLVPPGDFITQAEHTGLIKPLTLYVLDDALRQWREWHEDGLDIKVAVNLSVRALLDHGLPDDVAALLARHAAPASALELEITESTIMADPVRARVILDELHAMGVGLAIDDFGTGYSSLGYLKRLPVDEIKIDRSFVMTMGIDRNDATIVQSTIDLGRNLGLRVVAEGIQTDEVRRKLSELGCPLGQGYLFSPPLEAPELYVWAMRRRRAALAA